MSGITVPSTIFLLSEIQNIEGGKPILNWKYTDKLEAAHELSGMSL
jgi:hypothetical protein